MPAWTRARALILILALASVTAGALNAQETPGPELPATQSEPEPLPEPSPTPVTEPEGPSVSVRLRSNRFMPAIVRIAPGTTVIWTSEEPEPDLEHNVIARDYRWASSNFVAGESYQRRFTLPGEYRYFCDLHGGMAGRVTVE